jgi:cytochrome P450
MDQDALNLTDPTFFATGDPDAIWRRLRREDPVSWTQGRLSRGFWSVTKFADIKHVYSETRTFSSGIAGPALPPAADFEDPEKSAATRLHRSGAQLPDLDGAPHAELRRAFAGMFGQAQIEALEDKVRTLSNQIIDDLEGRDTFDFALDVAARLPITVICDLMGVPREDWDQLYRWANMHASPEDPEFSIGTAIETSETGTRSIFGYCMTKALERRTNPGTDILSMVGTARFQGRLLTDEEAGFNGFMFFAAGHETTRNALAAGMAELIRNPAEFQRLREAVARDPAALRLAAEECVRWATPLTHQLRVATRDVELGGKAIREGDWVVLWNPSANRDEDAFAEPYRFDSLRQPNVHLGFGHGAHFCLGTHLARLELRIMLRCLLDRMPALGLLAEPERAASNLFAGIKHMHVERLAA